jgi:hypothetical protein
MIWQRRSTKRYISSASQGSSISTAVRCPTSAAYPSSRCADRSQGSTSTVTSAIWRASRCAQISPGPTGAGVRRDTARAPRIATPDRSSPRQIRRPQGTDGAHHTPHPLPLVNPARRLAGTDCASSIRGQFAYRCHPPETTIAVVGPMRLRSVWPLGAYWRIEMTTASPPRLSISPSRFAFRCMITPASFCIQRSPPLAVPSAKP